MKKSMISYGIAATALSFVFTGCFSSGDSTNDPNVKTAYLIDSAVVGVSYTTPTQSGTTEAGGAFKYKDGESITFKVGSATIGTISSINSDGKVLPQDIAGVSRSSTSTSAVKNIARFFQTLDDDGDPSNGINILSSASSKLTTSMNIQTASATQLSSLVTLAGKTLVTESVATSHLSSTVASLTTSSSSTSSSSTSSSSTSSSSTSSSSTSSSSSGSDNSTPQSVTYTTSGTITDGKIKGATVFADLDGDGEWNSTEPTFSTDDNGNFTLSSTSSTGSNPINGKKIIGFGGTDTSTGHPFEGRLKAVAEDGKKPNVSPLSTFVAALVENNVSIADAKKKVAKNLGIEVTKIDDDPTKNPKLFFAAQKVQKAAESFASTQGGDFNDAFDTVFTAMAGTIKDVALDNIPAEMNVTAVANQVETEVKKVKPAFIMPPAVKTSVKNLTSKIDEFKALDINATGTNLLSTLNNLGSVVNAQSETIKGAIQTAVNSGTLSTIAPVTVDINATDIANKVVEAVESNTTYVDPTAKALDKAIKALDAVSSVYFGANNDMDSNKELRYLTSDLNSSIVGVDTNITGIAGFDANDTAFSNDDLNITWRFIKDGNISLDTNITSDGNITKAYYHQYLDAIAEVNASYTNESNDTASIIKVKKFKLRINRIEATPVAEDLNVTIDEDTVLKSDVNATDLNIKDTLTYSLQNVTELNGSVVFTDPSEGNFTFTPTKDFNGTTWFTYRTKDDTGRTSDANVTLTVNQINDAPVVSELNIPSGTTILEDTDPFKIDYSASDVETAYADLNITAESNNTNLITVAIGADQNLTVTPVANAHGYATITLKVSDGEANVTKNIVISITSVNDAPEIGKVSDISLDEDGNISSIELNVTDPDASDTHTYDAISSDQNITVSINSTTGELNITKANKDVFGDFNITVSVKDEYNATSSHTFDLNITAVNDAPIVDDNTTLSVNEDTNITIDILPFISNRFVDGNDTFSIDYDVNTTHGILHIEDNKTSITFQPTLNFDGNDSFTYTVNDGNGASDDGNITLSILPVNDAPVANDFNITLEEDTNATIDFTSHISDVEDTNASDLNITYLQSSNDSNFTEVNATGYIYSPVLNFDKNESLIYTVRDTNGSETNGTIKFVVTPVNDAPVIDITDATMSMLEDSNKTKIAYTISDVDNNVSLFTDGNYTYSSSDTSIVTLDFNASGFYANFVHNANGSVTVELNVTDGNLSASDTIELNVTAVEDSPDVNQTIDQNISEDANSYDINISAYDPDDDNITYAIQEGSDLASLSIDDNGTLTIHPNSNAVGEDTITIRVTDENNNSVDMTFNLNITNVNDAPEIPVAPQDINISIGNDYSQGITVKDPDIQYGDTLTFDINDSNFSSYGILSSLKYETNSGGEKVATVELNGTARKELNTTTFTLTVTDSNGSEVNTTFDMTINPYVANGLKLPDSIDPISK